MSQAENSVASSQSETSSGSSDRQLLIDAHAKGGFATLLTFFRLSGPGWLQSAITLGGGSLISSLFLGVLCGVSMLWVQLIAMVFGVIMLSAISYVTLSSRLRPFDAINRHINPLLGIGWLLATVLANVIWCMPQFSLCFDAIDKGFLGGSLDQAAVKAEVEPAAKPAEPVASANGTAKTGVEEKAKVNEESKAEEPSFSFAVDQGNLDWRLFGMPIKVRNYAAKFGVSFLLLAFATTMVVMSSREGAAAKWFDIILKVIIGIIVLCFVGVVVVLSTQGKINWGEIGAGFIPNLSLWFQPTDTLQALIDKLPEGSQAYWKSAVVDQQRDVMISTFATAVGINMTFLLPYSLLARNWDRPFRGLARFDLVFGMFLPFIVVTSCVVISAAAAFHAKGNPDFLSSDPAVVMKSAVFEKASQSIAKRLKVEKKFEQLDLVSKNKEEMAKWIVSLPVEEKTIACNLFKRSSNDMAKAMAPLFASADEGSNSKTGTMVFSIGALAMGFSTIIILMLINGYAFAELTGSSVRSASFIVGIMIAGGAGFAWPLFWQGDSKLWVAIVASTFGFLLLPIAYASFLLLMNSDVVLGSEKPRGARRWMWNILLGTAFVGTALAVGATLVAKFSKTQGPEGSFVLGAAACFLALAVIGFFTVRRPDTRTSTGQ